MVATDNRLSAPAGSNTIADVWVNVKCPDPPVHLLSAGMTNGAGLTGGTIPGESSGCCAFEINESSESCITRSILLIAAQFKHFLEPGKHIPQCNRLISN